MRFPFPSDTVEDNSNSSVMDDDRPNDAENTILRSLQISLLAAKKGNQKLQQLMNRSARFLNESLLHTLILPAPPESIGKQIHLAPRVARQSRTTTHNTFSPRYNHRTFASPIVRTTDESVVAPAFAISVEIQGI